MCLNTATVDEVRPRAGAYRSAGQVQQRGSLVFAMTGLRKFVLPFSGVSGGMTLRSAFLGLVGMSLSLLFPIDEAQAKTTALLIGVSDYDETIGLADLRGPGNDVALMRDVLRARGVTDIRLLADEIEGGERPTKSAIMSALGALAAEAEDGDLFIIHMSGHGTRQPDANGDEADGYDEVFLPADVTRAEPGTAQIPNGIVDEEIGSAIAAIRMKGADVWFIMDACHSGTGLRAGGLNTADRFIDPTALGLPPVSANQNDLAQDRIVSDDVGASDLPGRLIAFYSAQADELAREVDFGASGEASRSENNWYGFFTAKLANRILTAGSVSYRQLFQGILTDMNTSELASAARLQTPHWEGDLIDAVAFGGSDTVGVRQYAIDDDYLSAGAVHGIVEGTILELVADAAAGDGESIGFAQVEEVKSLTAFVRPVSDHCIPSPDSLCDAEGRLPAEASFARVTVVPVKRTVTLSGIIDRGDKGTGAPAEVPEAVHPLNAALGDAIESFNSSNLGRFTVDANAYDIEVSLYDDRLWFGVVTNLGGEPAGYSIPVDNASEAELYTVLERIAYAERFADTLSSIVKGTSLLNLNPVSVSAHWQRSDPQMLDKPGSAIDPVRECRRIFRRGSFSEETDLPSGAEIKQCDRLRFAARGEVAGVRDVNRIHIDANFCVRAEYTRIEDNRTTVPIGGDMIMCSDCPGGYSAGNERLFVVISEARPNREPLNLQGIVDNCAGERATRGARAQTFSDFVKSLGKKPGTRGAMGGFATENVWIEQMHWQVVPRAVALQERSIAQN